MITYKQLNRKHGEYNAPFWQELKVLANGGSNLDRKTLEKLLPKSPGEEHDVYKHRIDKAYYTPYLGNVLGYYSSSVITDPLTINTSDENSQMPEFYEEFENSVYRHGSFKININEHVRSVLDSAFLTQTEYVLVDLPSLPDEDEPPSTKLEEELLGMDQAYLCRIDACDVYNFRTDEEDNLIWINIHNKTHCLESITDEHLTYTETFTIYSADKWDRFTYKWMENEQAPNENSIPTEIKSGIHSFGRVPVVRFKLPDPLYFGDKIGSMAKNIFQKMNYLDYASDRSLFQFLVVKLEPQSDTNPNPIADDLDRGKNQILGNGRVMTMAKGDSVEMIGGDSKPLEFTQNHITFLRDEMSRVIGQSALNLTGNSKMLNRSADSKSFDRKSIEIILEHLGQICKDYAEQVFDMVAAGRKENFKFQASGMANYEQVGIDEISDIQTKITSLNIPSATFNLDFTMETVKVLLEGEPEDRLEMIRQELEIGYKKQQEQMSKEKEINTENK